MEQSPYNTDEAARFGTLSFYASLGRALVAMCAVIPVLAAIEFVDERLDGELESLAGIRPRRIDGLGGIFLAPFVHNGFDHLRANSTPLILLGTFVLAAGTRRFLVSTLLIALVSGLGVWLLTPPRYVVVGSSGIIFGWLGLLFVRGIVERSWWNIGVALVAGLLYGWQLVMLFPSNEGISWQGHLFGFAAGAIAAVLVRRRPDRLPSGPGVAAIADRAADPYS